MPRVYVPSRGPEDWQGLLADPELHWRTGFSARSTAHCWESAPGLPTEIRAILHQESKFESIEPLLIIPEHQVHLPGGTRPSQMDVWVLARTPAGLVSIGVEAKVAEPFGPTLQEWQASSSTGKLTRVAAIREIVGIGEDIPSSVRYQLLHRTAATILEAERFFAPAAVTLIHAFNSPEESFVDFSTFAAMLGVVTPAKDTLLKVGNVRGRELYIGWVTGDNQYLAS